MVVHSPFASYVLRAIGIGSVSQNCFGAGMSIAQGAIRGAFAPEPAERRGFETGRRLVKKGERPLLDVLTIGAG